ncbi:MAG: GxxExxY protein [Ignavibacteria bacterium]
MYETCFCHELRKKNLKFYLKFEFLLSMTDLLFDEGFRIDVFVEDKVICELKAVNEMNPVYEAQLLTHLKLTEKRLGYLINFNVPLIKNGIKRIIL